MDDNGGTIMTRDLRRSAALTVGAVLLGSVLAVPSAGAAPSADPGLIRCTAIDGLRYCTEIGFTEESAVAVQSRARKARTARGVTGATTPSTGDLTLGAHLAALAKLTPAELRVHQDAQIAQARDAVGRLKLVDFVDEKVPMPAGFFSKYPSLRVKEGSPQARALREGTSMRYAAAAGKVAAADVSNDPDVDYEYIMPGVAQKQAKDYWCGPATMKMMDLGDNGWASTQATWADRTGTTTDGTWIGSMVAGMNSHTTWDDLAGIT